MNGNNVNSNTNIDLLVFQATPFCNINCKYCYLEDRANVKKIGINTIRDTIRNLVSDNLINHTLNISWHCGEPLIISIEYYKLLFEEILKNVPNETKVNHFIQTNATLINQKWCDFFNQFNVNIGVSIDGPQKINDANRLTMQNKSTFKLALEGIEHLNKNNIGFTAIAVISKHSIDYPEEIYDFFCNIGASRLGLNFEKSGGTNIKTSLLDVDDIEGKVSFFLEKLYNYYLQNNGSLKIREFESVKNKLLGMPLDYFYESGNMSHELMPFSIITVDVHGDYSTFSPQLLGIKSKEYDNFIIGNISNGSFLSKSNIFTLNTIHSSIAVGLEKCKKNCDYFLLCGGSSPFYKYSEHNTFNVDETIYCKFSKQIPINIILEKLSDKLPLSLNKT